MLIEVSRCDEVMNDHWNGINTLYELTKEAGFIENSEGEPTEYRWYCPAVRGALIEWQEDIILGVPAYSELISFTPGEIPTSQIEIEFESLFDTTNVTLNSPIKW